MFDETSEEEDAGLDDLGGANGEQLSLQYKCESEIMNFMHASVKNAYV